MTDPSARRILLINPNTTVAVTERVVAHLQPLLPAGTTLLPCTAAFGAPYIACEASHAVAAHAVLQAWASRSAAPQDTPTEVLIACFGDPGLFALREHSTVAVTGLAEAAFIEAACHGPFAVVTGGPRWAPMLQRLAQALGFGSALRHIETVEPSGAQLLADPERARQHLQSACVAAAVQGVRAIIVGGAGLAGWAARLQPEFPMPLIDSVEAGLRVLLRGQAPAPRPPHEERPELVRWIPNLGRPSANP